MVKRVSVFLVFLVFASLSAAAQLMLQDQFVVVASGNVYSNGEYLAESSLTNTTNSNVFGGSVVGFNTNELWYGVNDMIKPQLGGLTYSIGDRALAGAGGLLEVDLSGDDDSVREVAREIAGVSASTEWYFSALIKATADADGTAVVRFDDIDGSGGSHSPYMWGVGFGF